MPRQREYIDVLKKAIKIQQERGSTYRVDGRDGHTAHADILEALFPNGLDFDATTAEKFIVLNNIIGKVVRYALQLKNGGHEDSAMDICVYGAILAAFHEEPQA
jgi:sugar lactone lactonase YvrE